MSNHPPDTAILIKNPFTLLYWLYFRGLALRRYANSIHADLDEDLTVWEVRHAVGDDPRFRALCHARWWLLACGPLVAVLLAGLLAFLFGAAFAWRPSLLIATGYVAGTLLGDALRWRFPRRASSWLNRVVALFVILGFGYIATGILVHFIELPEFWIGDLLGCQAENEEFIPALDRASSI